MEVKPGYKQTEVGVIPEDWDVATLAEVCRAITDGTHFTPRYVSAGVPFYSVENVTADNFTDTKFISEEEHAVLVRRCCPEKGDILLTRIGSLGETKQLSWDVRASIYVSLALLKLNDRAVPAFVASYTKSPQFVRDIEKRSLLNATPKKINMEDIGGVPIPLPPTESEQRAIAGALSDADELIGALERLIAKKRDLKQAAMQQLLSGQTRLPGFHGEWEVKQLGDIASLYRENVNPAGAPDKIFVHFSLPAFDCGKSPVSEVGAAVGSNKFRVPPNAVLVSKLNPRIPRIWMPAVIPESAICSTEFLVLVPRTGVSRAFLQVVCSSPGFCERMELAATGTTGSHQRMNSTDALTIAMNFPPTQDEQIAIAKALSDMDEEITALEQRRAKTRALKQGMMQELLTGRIRLI